MKSDWKRLRHTLTILGIGLAAAGYLRYSTQALNTPVTEGLMIGGGVLFLAGVVMSYREVAAFFGTRSSRLGANTLTLTVLVLIVIGLLNFLGYKHHWHVDLTTEKLYTLSDQSRRIAAGLKQDVDVIHFSKTPDANVRSIVQEYSNLSSHIHYREVDPQAHPEIARQYAVLHADQVVVASGKQNQTLNDTSEQEITNAIVKVTRDTVKTVCFLQGHGERSTSSNEMDGYSGMAGALKNEGYMVSTTTLVTTGSVPADCSVFVVAGPKQSLLPQETQLITKFLDGGGKAMFLFDPDTDPKVGDLLQSWNIALGSNVVVDVSGVGQVFGQGPESALVMDYGQSPITQGFNNGMTMFFIARTADIADKSKFDPQDTCLLTTSPHTFTIPHFPRAGEPVQHNPANDHAVCLGVSGEKNVEPGTDGTAKSARLVVIGNASFVENQWAGFQHNGDLFMNAINWLAQDENLISIRPKSPTVRNVILTATQQRELLLVSLIFLPGIVLLSGGFVWLKRR